MPLIGRPLEMPCRTDSGRVGCKIMFVVANATTGAGVNTQSLFIGKLISL
jgi:hypothetical protein